MIFFTNRIKLKVLCLFILILFSEDFMVKAQLEWQKRTEPDRFEGTKSYKKSAHLELLAAMVIPETSNTEENKLSKSNIIHLLFFNPEEINDTLCAITVREFRQYNYWMQPIKKQWPKGWSQFTWPVNSVLINLDPVPKLSDLNAVARIGAIDPEYSRKIIPVILFKNKSITSVSGYRFVLITPENADIYNVKCEWYSLEDVNQPPVDAWKPNREKIHAGKPLVMKWNCKDIKEGWYKMLITGIINFTSSEEVLQETYIIYHRQKVDNLP